MRNCDQIEIVLVYAKFSKFTRKFSNPHTFLSLWTMLMCHNHSLSTVYSYKTFFSIEKIDKWYTKMLFRISKDQKFQRERERYRADYNLFVSVCFSFTSFFSFFSMFVRWYCVKVDGHMVHEKTHDFFLYIHILVRRNRVRAYLNTKMMSHYKYYSHTISNIKSEKKNHFMIKLRIWSPCTASVFSMLIDFFFSFRFVWLELCFYRFEWKYYYRLSTRGKKQQQTKWHNFRLIKQK